MSQSAAEFVKAHKGGGAGRFYLTAKLLKSNPGLTGTIAARPYVEEVTFATETKDVFRLPVNLDSAIDVPDGKGGTRERNDALFNPGVNAVQYLLDELGAEEASWVGRSGKFERRELEDSSFVPWFFVPTGTAKRPAQKAKAPAAEKATRTSAFKCGMCPKSFETIAKLQAHVEDVHGS